MPARRLLVVRSELRFSGTTERLRAGVVAATAAGWEVHVLARPGARSEEIAAAGAVVHVGDPARRGPSAPFVRRRARRLVDRIGAALTLVVGQELAPLAARLRRAHVLELDRPPRERLPWSRAHLRAVLLPCRTLIEAAVNRARLPRERVAIVAHAPRGLPGARPAFAGDGPPTVGAAGGLEAGLGAGALLEAGRALMDAGRALRLVILGEGPAGDEVRHRARQLAIAEHVTVAAPSAPSTAELLAEVDVYVCPQPEGTPGWLTTQALALGRPTMLAANQGSFELVRDGVDGFLVDRADPSGLARGIATLLDDPAAARTVGERARARWTAQPDAFGERLPEVLEQALASDGL